MFVFLITVITSRMENINFSFAKKREFFSSYLTFRVVFLYQTLGVLAGVHGARRDLLVTGGQLGRVLVRDARQGQDWRLEVFKRVTSGRPADHKVRAGVAGR